MPVQESVEEMLAQAVQKPAVTMVVRQTLLFRVAPLYVQAPSVVDLHSVIMVAWARLT